MLNHQFIHTFAVANTQTYMKLQRFFILSLTALISVATHGQLFHALGLGIDKCKREGLCSQPRMHVEGDILYVCTNQGLYSKDLSRKESAWQIVGFKDIPLQDYVRKGEDMIALRYNIDGCFLLLTHDGGKTYEDVTPDVFEENQGWWNVLTNLVQHPTDPNTLLVLSTAFGVFQSSDFGQTWKQLADCSLGNSTAAFIGYHPQHPEIIYNSGEDDALSPKINLSYDGGETWNVLSPNFPGDNCVHRIAFHPTQSVRWIVGGEGVVYTSSDNGYSWETQNYWDDTQRFAYWYFTEYDNENSEIVYMAGTLGDNIKVMCSTDGGNTWNLPQTNPIKKTSYELVNDLRQYGNKLLIYTESDVYEILKSELLAQTLPVQNMTTAPSEESSESYDLFGRPVSSVLPRGVYIKDGRKMVVK